MFLANTLDSKIYTTFDNVSVDNFFFAKIDS